ncbi:MAG: TetR/AcrR family transcriptional regulator C-terminal domain-containing protein, partial [Chloroflexota bacterium]
RVFGFNQDLYDSGAGDPEAAAAFASQLAAAYPNIAAIATAASHEGGIGGCDDDYEFAFGLDLILDGLERRRTAAQEPR